MSLNSKIAWTEATWNVFLGCSKISPGCKGCYAISQVHRLAGNPNPKIRKANEGLTVIQGGGANWTGRVNFVPDRLDVPLRRKKPTVYFVNSLSDLFHPKVCDADIAEVFKVMYRANWHTFQILTKHGAGEDQRMVRVMERVVATFGPVPRHIWLGVSIESQEQERRIEVLRDCPAAVRFLSIEPLLGPVNVRGHLMGGTHPGQCDNCGNGHGFMRCPNYGSIAPNYVRNGRALCSDFRRVHFAIDWVIVGGESGPDARACHMDWIREIVKQCKETFVPCFVKQLGSNAIQAMLATGAPGFGGSPDGRVPLQRVFLDKKGGDPEEWPERFPRDFPQFESESLRKEVREEGI